MSDKKAVTLNGLILPNALLILVFICMILVGAYMTQHYYDTFYPKGITDSASICDINAFWSCDKATKSELGSFFNVPTSTVAIILGVFGLFASFMGRKGMEQTLKSILIANFAICILLAIYSLAALGGLCLMCTVFYVLSGIALFIMFKFSELPPAIEPQAVGIFLITALIPSGYFAYDISDKKSSSSTRLTGIVEQYKNLNSYGEPPYVSPYMIAKSSENFNDAPIRVTLFSDFQCPFCKMVAEQFEDVVKKYKGKINVQYMFYPLDMTCNSEMKGSMHPFACQASYLAACDKNKFVEIHDHIFKHQDSISFDQLKKWEKDFGLTGCLENKDLQDIVQQTLNAGKHYKIKSTPSMIINGKKIDGALDTPALEAIFNSLL